MNQRDRSDSDAPGEIRLVSGTQPGTAFLDTTAVAGMAVVDQITIAILELTAGTTLSVYTTYPTATEEITDLCGHLNLEYLSAIPVSTGGTTHLVRLAEPPRRHPSGAS